MSFFALIDYRMGNLRSVEKALNQIGAEIRLAESPDDLDGACAMILPGVGNFGDGMHQLDSLGFTPRIQAWVNAGKPFLGICLGMHMLLDSSEEAPGVRGLGLVKGAVRKFVSDTEKIPHMGWNSVALDQSVPYFKALPEKPYFYFVHSFYADPDDKKFIAGKCDYIHPFAAVLSRPNLLAAQFHPEKSQENGLLILKNFVDITRKDLSL